MYDTAKPYAILLQANISLMILRVVILHLELFRFKTIVTFILDIAKTCCKRLKLKILKRKKLKK